MELAAFFRSVLEQDTASVVLCDLDHTIVYMNPAAIRSYEAYGGADLLGKNLLACHNPESAERIEQVLDWFRADVRHNRVFTAHRPAKNRDQYMIALRSGDGTLIGYYEKHEYRTPEQSLPYDLHD